MNESGDKVTAHNFEQPDPPASVELLYEAYSDDLRRFLIGVLKDRELAGEALQCVFQKAIQNGPDEAGNVRGWLFRVAYNEAMLIRRRQGREQRALGKAVEVRGGGVREAETVATDAVVLDETIQQVRQAIQELPANQQAVIRKRIYEEKTFAVIAEELGVPLGTVLTRMRLATQYLQQRLRES